MDEMLFDGTEEIAFTKQSRFFSMVGLLESNKAWRKKFSQKETDVIVIELSKLEKKTLREVNHHLSKYIDVNELTLNSRKDLVEDLNLRF